MKGTVLAVSVAAFIASGTAFVHAGSLAPNKTHAVLNVTYTNYDDVPQAKKKLVFVGQKKPKNKITVTTDMYGEAAFMIPREDSYTILCESLTGPFECGETPKRNAKAKIEIEGHTSSEGSESFNQKLSEDRANSVMEYMISKGISKDRVSAVGYGSSRPKEDNGTEAGRKANRRIEIRVVNKDEVGATVE